MVKEKIISGKELGWIIVIFIISTFIIVFVIVIVGSEIQKLDNQKEYYKSQMLNMCELIEDNRIPCDTWVLIEDR